LAEHVVEDGRTTYYTRVRAFTLTHATITRRGAVVEV